MDQKTEIMIAIGAAVGANCNPCFDHLYSKANEVSFYNSNICEAIEIGFKVKNGASIFMKTANGTIAISLCANPTRND